MSWKIKHIKIENFKYFHQSFDLDVDSHNLLIYGENGSGKSSIYWALYTLFQSRLKTSNAEVEKYFDLANGENLRNKYSEAGDISQVVVTFENTANPAEDDKIYTIAPGNITTRQDPDLFFDLTVTSSDFLNYKTLSKLTDKDNSVANDITELFIKEIYPYANFRVGYTDLDDLNTGILNAKKWHDYIYTSISEIEHQRGKRRAHFDKTGVKYGRFKKLVRKFHEELTYYLSDLSQRTTAMLSTKFHINDVELKFETDPSFDFDLTVPGSPRYRDHKLHPLHIRLNAKLKNSQLVGGEAEVLRPHSFFNEAKLTCIGLAIRLAVVDKKYVAGDNLASVLCLDDLMVSLDMSYRVPVVETLLGYSNKYQLCLFTHDRSLYNVIRGTIKDSGYSNWKYLEFFRSDPATEATEEPKVNYIEPKEGKDMVKLYMERGDYPAAGNYLRKYAEELIKGILPLNQTFDINDKGEIIHLMLRGLYDKTKILSNDGFCALYDIRPNYMPNIYRYLNRLMNPLSHDNKDIPIFRQELEDALVEVEKYKPIRDAKKVIVRRQDAGNKRFKMEMTNVSTGITKSIEFVTTEQWDYFDFAAPMGKKYKDCEVLVKAVNGCTIPLNCKMRVKKLYKELRSQSLLNAAGAPVFDQAIREITTGTLLSVL